MDKRELVEKIADIAAKVIGYVAVYVMVVFTIGLGIKVTQWVLSMMGVM